MFDVVRSVVRRSGDHNLSVAAAGVAFYALLALFPTLVAIVSLYGLIADPATVQEQIEQVSERVSPAAATLVGEQLTAIASTPRAGLGAGAAAGFLLALWSSSSAVQSLIATINVAHDVRDDRSYVRVRALALAFTLGAIVFVISASVAFGALPRLLDAFDVAGTTQVGLSVATYLTLAVVLVVGLSILYRYAPARRAAPAPRVNPGAVVAAVVWMIGSALFGVYATTLGASNPTYATLGAVAFTMLWLLVSSAAVLLGAEVDAELADRKADARSVARGSGDRPRDDESAT